MAEDADLAAIRAKRMAELQAQYGGGEGGGEGQKGQVEKQRQEQEREAMKNSILTQILAQDARARLNSIALVKPEKARAVEGMLIQMAQSGQLGRKVEESQLVELLERFSQQTQKKTKIKFDRRRYDDSDEDL